jgi:hypothetical protein
MYENLKKTVEILKNNNEEMLKLAIDDKSFDLITLLLFSKKIRNDTIINNIAKSLSPKMLLNIFDDCDDNVRILIVKSLFKFGRVDVFQYYLSALKTSIDNGLPMTENLSKFLCKFTSQVFLDVGVYGAFEIIEFVISGGILVRGDYHAENRYTLILRGYMDADVSNVPIDAVKNYFIQFVFPELTVSSGGSRYENNENNAKMSKLQNLVYYNYFGSQHLDLFIFFFKYICGQVNGTASSFIQISKMVANQKNPDIVSWLLKNEIEKINSKVFLSGKLVFEEHVDLFSTLINFTNSYEQDFSTIHEILFDDASIGKDSRFYQLVRLCIRNTQFEKVVANFEDNKNKLTSAKNFLNSITEILSLYIPCEPLVRIILIHF